MVSRYDRQVQYKLPAKTVRRKGTIPHDWHRGLEQNGCTDQRR
jgi:hypothetical protein